MVGQGRPLRWAGGRAWDVRTVCLPMRSRLVICLILLFELASAGEFPLFAAEGPLGIRFETSRRDLIFAPADEFSVSLKIALPEEVAGRDVDLAMELRAVGAEKPSWSQLDPLNVPIDGKVERNVAIPLPELEGVYVFSVSASPPRAFTTFGIGARTKPLVQRTVELLVFAEQPQRSVPDDDGWRQLKAIDPTNPRWWPRLPPWTQLRRLPGTARRQLAASEEPQIVQLDAGSYVELPPPGPDGQPHWQAYLLPVDNLSRPHLVEVEHPADRELQLGLSILEPSKLTSPHRQGFETSVYIDRQATGQEGSTQRHRLIYWPATEAPVLLVTNGHPTKPAHFGAIRILAGPAQLFRRDVKPQHNEENVARKRLIAAYLSDPRAVTAFAANEQPTPAGEGQSLEALFKSTQRLVDYLRYGKYNAAVVSVVGPTGPIYPTQIFVPRSALAKDGNLPESQDLPPPDPLELLLRTFDREGLALVPALRFSHPLAELEALRRSDDENARGIELVDHAGRNWKTVGPTNSASAAGYNLLDDRVQAAMLSAAREVLERYGHHPSLAGLAIQLSDQGAGVLPGLHWGMDQLTMSRFQRETGNNLSAAGLDPRTWRAQLLQGEQVQAWQTWRAQRISDFYRQLTSLVCSGREERRVILTTEDLVLGERFRQRLQPLLLIRPDVDGLLLESGIDTASLNRIPGLVLPCPKLVAPTAPLVDRAVDLQVDDSWEAIVAEHGSPSGVLIYHRVEQKSLSRLPADSTLSRNRAELSLWSHPVPSGWRARRPLAETLLSADPDVVLHGGPTPGFGQEEAMRPLLNALTLLPAGADDVETRREGPIVVRTYKLADAAFLSVLNVSPWQTDLKLTVNVPTRTQFHWVADSQTARLPETLAPSQTFDTGSHLLPLLLDPYTMTTARISDARASVTGVRLLIDERARRELAARIDDHHHRDLNSQKHCEYSALLNPGFEVQGGESSAHPIRGWDILDPRGLAKVEYEGSAQRSGKTCLFLESTGPPVGIASHSFRTPPTGQLAVTAFIRAEEFTPQTRVHIVIESTNGTPYRAVGILGENEDNRLDRNWKQYLFGQENLPLGSNSSMRMRFEVHGSGRLMIDDVQLYSLLFPFGNDLYPRQLRFAFVKKIRTAENWVENGDFAACQRLLDSYWPLFLEEYLPPERPTEPSPIVDDQPKSTPTVEAAEERGLSVGERFRRLFWR